MSSDYEIKAKQLPPEDGGGYLAWVPDLPGCMSDDETSAASDRIRTERSTFQMQRD